MIKNYLGTVSIFVTDRHNLSVPINKILTAHSRLIQCRLGFNVDPKCLSNCLAIISLIVCGQKKEIAALVAELGKLKGVIVKPNIMK